MTADEFIQSWQDDPPRSKQEFWTRAWPFILALYERKHPNYAVFLAMASTLQVQKDGRQTEILITFPRGSAVAVARLCDDKPLEALAAIIGKCIRSTNLGLHVYREGEEEPAYSWLPPLIDPSRN